jgi:seryl-tRNA synthetase
LLWEQKEESLDAMIQRAQLFEDSRSRGQSKSKKTLRTTEQNTSSTTALREEITQLKEQLSNLQKEKRKTFQKKKPLCWNCGKRGHFSRKCSEDKIGNGFTHRPKPKTSSQEQQNSKETQALNYRHQGMVG